MLKKLVILMIVLVLVAPVTAQEPTILCTGLSDEDCDLLTEAVNTSLAQGSFQNSTISIEVGGAGGTSTGNAVAVTASGPMTVNPIGGINSTSIAFDLTLEEETTSGEIRILPDGFYVRGDDGNWFGTPSSDDNAAAFVALFAGDDLSAILNSPGVTTVSRVEDMELDGEMMQVFEYDVDIAAFLLTPPILALIEEAVESGLDPENAANFGSTEDIRGFVALLPAILTSDTIGARLWISPDTNLVSRFEIFVDIGLNAAFLDPNAENIALVLNIVSDLDDYGTDAAIAAPEDFQPLEIDVSEVVGDLNFGAPTGEDPNRFNVENTLAYDESVTGTLTGENPEDIWGFDAVSGDVVTIVLRADDPNSSLDTRVRLLDADGTEIAENDDHDTARDLGLFDSVIESFEIPADGQYRIVATWFSQTRDGDYVLTVERE